MPADLYFLRQGRLWRWAAHRAELKEIAPQEDDPVIEYQLTADGRYVVYLVASGHLYVWDQVADTHTQVPISGTMAAETTPYIYTGRGPLAMQQFALTPDGRYLVYMAWGVAPQDEPLASRRPGDYGTLFVLDLVAPGQQISLGFCGVQDERFFHLTCTGFILSADGQYVAFSDGRGVWVTRLPGGEPQLLREHAVLDHKSLCGIWRPLAWSADNRWLLVNLTCWEIGKIVVMDASSGEILELPDTDYYLDGGHTEWAIVPGGVLIAYYYPELAAERRGVVYQAQISSEGSLELSLPISRTTVGMFWPIGPHLLRYGQVSVVYEGCAGDLDQHPGIFSPRSDGTWETVLPLPVHLCDDGLPGSGAVVWASDGSAFLYLDEHAQPIIIGLGEGQVLWDVRSLLGGASGFKWGVSGTRH